MTTTADVKKANSNADRTGYQITQSMLTNPATVAQWLRQLALLEAAIRSYAREHGVDVQR